jgi:phage N-6-adenine-methyltransferase
LEAVHISGYTFDRAYQELEWLLDGDRWQTVGEGFKDINDFLATIDFSPFRIAAAQRRKIARRLEEIEASQRATAKMLGVDHRTIGHDLKDDNGENSPQHNEAPQEANESKDDNGENSPRSMDVHYSSETDEWATPQDLFDELNDEFGFELDVCALPASAKCTTYFTPDDDGLKQDWTGVCWMNPPYGDVIGQWVEKARVSAEAGATIVAVVAEFSAGAFLRVHRLRLPGPICFTLPVSRVVRVARLAECHALPRRGSRSSSALWARRALTLCRRSWQEWKSGLPRRPCRPPPPG